MSITKERKEELIGEFARSEGDSGSPEVQVSLLTSRIGRLTQHLQMHSKDLASRRGLLKLVSRRRRQLDYLRQVDPQRYLSILQRLNLRK